MVREGSEHHLRFLEKRKKPRRGRWATRACAQKRRLAAARGSIRREVLWLDAGLGIADPPAVYRPSCSRIESLIRPAVARMRSTIVQAKKNRSITTISWRVYR